MLFGFGAAQAATVTIDFIDPSIPFDGSVYDNFVTDGYRFSFDPMPYSNPYFKTEPGIAMCPGCVLNMESVIASTFDIIGFSSQGVFGDEAAFLEVTGFLEGGGTVSATLAQSYPNEMTYNLNWTGLTRFTIGSSLPGITIVTSVTASQVPIPAAVWLFASGLGLLGWMTRRAKV